MFSDLADRQDALRLFVASSKIRLEQLLQRLQWSQEGVLKLHHEAKETDSADQLPPSCLAAAEQSVQLSAQQLQQLLGTTTRATNTFDQLQSNYSAAQKLQIYEHVIKISPSQRFSFEDNAQFAELVAVTKKTQQKQRRHRKSKPTLREEIHQLLELQMQALQQQRRQEFAANERLDPQQPQLNKHLACTPRRRSPIRKQGYHPSGNSSRQRSRSRSRQRQHSRSGHRERSRQRQRSSSRSRQRQHLSNRSGQRKRSSSRSRQREHRSSRSGHRQRSHSRQPQRSPSKLKRRSRSPRQHSKRSKRPK